MNTNVIYHDPLVTCLVAFPSSTCLAFCPNSRELIVSAMFDSRGLMFTNMQACNSYTKQHNNYYITMALCNLLSITCDYTLKVVNHYIIIGH